MTWDGSMRRERSKSFETDDHSPNKKKNLPDLRGHISRTDLRKPYTIQLIRNIRKVKMKGSASRLGHCSFSSIFVKDEQFKSE